MQVLTNILLKEYTNYKIGGPTPKLYIVRNINDLKKISDEDLKSAYILGGGTNILVSDEGVNNVVIKIDFQRFSLDHRNSILTIGAGFNLSEAANDLARRSFKGLCHVSGIPGTIGGAITMNASASHGAISDYLISVKAYNKETREEKMFTKEECKFNFRESIFKNSQWIIIFANFKVEREDKKKLLSLSRKIIAHRNKNYPLTFPSAGCWFKRDWGGREIIKKINMVGANKGGAVISPMFPAFILNTGKATAKDVYSLVREIQEKAKEINEPMPLEIVIWGEI